MQPAVCASERGLVLSFGAVPTIGKGLRRMKDIETRMRCLVGGLDPVDIDEGDDEDRETMLLVDEAAEVRDEMLAENTDATFRMVASHEVKLDLGDAIDEVSDDESEAEDASSHLDSLTCYESIQDLFPFLPQEERWYKNHHNYSVSSRFAEMIDDATLSTLHARAVTENEKFDQRKTRRLMRQLRRAAKVMAERKRRSLRELRSKKFARLKAKHSKIFRSSRRRAAKQGKPERLALAS